jgi:hypothetical protein
MFLVGRGPLENGYSFNQAGEFVDTYIMCKAVYQISVLQDAKGNNSPCTFNNEDKDYCSSRTEVFCMDWRVHLSIFIYLPANVDFQTGI